jgi:anti-sigma factor RsiW
MSEHELHHCKKMESWLSSTADDTLKGWKRSFTEWHVRHCPGCAAALASLKEICVRLASLAVPPKSDPPESALSQDRWSAIESAWESVEERSG